MISLATCWLALSLCVLSSSAGPSQSNVGLAKKYAPQWKFHPNENFFPSTVEKFLAGPVQLLDDQGTVVLSSVNVENIDDPPEQGSGMYLTTDVVEGTKEGGFLRGQNPSDCPSKAYTFVAPKPNNIVDIFYWLYTPFNYGKDTTVGLVGLHVGDWERMAVRTENGVATQVNYYAHDGAGSGNIPWEKVPKFDDGKRPVGYVANGSHGFWNSPGTFTYLQIGNFTLQDVTAEGGVAWDVQNDLQVFEYPDTYNLTDSWLNFKGAWGNQSPAGCGFLCELDDGPIGPYRPDVFDGTFGSPSLR